MFLFLLKLEDELQVRCCVLVEFVPPTSVQGRDGMLGHLQIGKYF